MSRRCHFTLLTGLALSAVCFLPQGAGAQTVVTVSGMSDPWLAGMPDGTVANEGDTAPAQSPVLVPITLPAGKFVMVSNVTGSTAVDPNYARYGGDGESSLILPHQAAGEYSKSDLVSPADALIGVFLTNAVPSGAAPARLDFTTRASRDYSALRPLLNQTFFFGDGLTSGGLIQTVAIPAGATRLFLGTMDGAHWGNNIGSLSVQVSVVPAPGSLLVSAAGGGLLLLRLRRSNPVTAKSGILA